jgi:hypothetical protein
VGRHIRATPRAAISRGWVEDAARLDVPGILRACRRLYPEAWARWERGEAVTFPPMCARVPAGELVVVPSLEGLRGQLRLAWADGQGRAGDGTVELEALRPFMGGLSWYALCPRTGRRCGLLYRPAKARGFASRVAHRLRYRSQGETPAELAARRARRWRLRLGEDPPVVGGQLPDPPPRMRADQYLGLCRRIRAAEAEAGLSVLAVELGTQT